MTHLVLIDDPMDLTYYESSRFMRFIKKHPKKIFGCVSFGSITTILLYILL